MDRGPGHALLAGNFQLVARLPRMLLPWRNPVWLQLVSRLLLFCVAFAATDPRSTVPVGTGSSVPVGTGSSVPVGTGSSVPVGTGSSVPIGTGSSVPIGTAVDEDARGDEEHAGNGQPEPETVPRPAAGERG